MEGPGPVSRILRIVARPLLSGTVGAVTGVAVYVLGLRDATSGFVLIRIGAVVLIGSLLLLTFTLSTLIRCLHAAGSTTASSTRPDPELERFFARARIWSAVRTGQDVGSDDRAEAIAVLARRRQPAWLIAAGGAAAVWVAGRMVGSASHAHGTTRAVILGAALALLGIPANSGRQEWRIRRWQRRYLPLDPRS